MKIPVATPDITEADVEYVSKCVRSGWVSGISPFVKEFEDKFAEWNGSKYAVATGSGTTALHLALAALDLQPGDEVIMPSFTMIATANACHYLGVKPVFCEIEPDTWCMDVESAKEKITDKIKAIMPVHIYGHPVDLGKIMELSFDHDLLIIEDCAEAHGATWKRRKVGTFGDVGCFDSRTNIQTIDGKKRISKIKEGDFVLTHKGRYRKVTKLHKRLYEGDWYELSCGSMRRTSLWTERCVRATEEHPLLIFRDGKKQWMPIKNVKKLDWVYTWTKKCEVCGKTIPFYWRICEYCNPAQLPASREAIAKAKDKGGQRTKHHHKHYYEDIIPYAEKLIKEGYRVIPIGEAMPDIIAIKNGRVVAYEIENQLVRKRKREKYNESEKALYDDIIWIEPEKKKNKSKRRCPYVIEGKLARVPITAITKSTRTPRWVYNLTVEEDESYFAANIAVHNCYSFYANKILTCFPAKTHISIKPPKGKGSRCIKYIENIKIGDEVLTYNEKTSQKEYEKVVRVYEREAPLLLNLKLSNGNEIAGTPNHPIFVIGRGWIPMSKLEVGDELLQYRYRYLGYILEFVHNPNVELATITHIEEMSHNKPVYNIETEKNHNYFAYGILVHNCGEGGIITTDDFDLAERAKWLRAHAFGRHGKHYWHEHVGYGYRMGGMQAALGTSQLERIDYYINKRQINAWYYKSLLKQLGAEDYLTFPVQLDNYSNVYWMFSAVLNEGIDRAKVIKSLAEKGIETRTFFYPLHKMPVYQTDDDLPITDDIASRGMNLPSGNQLTNEQIEYVCDSLMKILM